MCLLYLRRIHGCASNTLRAKDPQYIDHLILVCHWLFEFSSFSAIKRVTKTCPGQKVRNGCLTETNHKHEREWWKGGRIGVCTATLATSFLDILGDPNLSPFRPLQNANQELQMPLSCRKSIWAQDIAGVRVSCLGESVMSWLSAQCFRLAENSTKQTATSWEQSYKLSYNVKFLHNLYATYKRICQATWIYPYEPAEDPSREITSIIIILQSCTWSIVTPFLRPLVTTLRPQQLVVLKALEAEGSKNN
jgi:hypothetical protein